MRPTPTWACVRWRRSPRIWPVACAGNSRPPRRVRTVVGVRSSGVLGLLCVLVLSVGCSGTDEDAPGNPGGAVHEMQSDDDGFRGAGLTDPYQLPDVALTDTSGSSYSLVDDTTASATLIFFGYTNCPDVCTLVMADLASAMTRVDPDVAESVDVLFITTDPARDDEATIREYLDRFDPAFEGLTGPMPEIMRAAKPLGVAIEGKRRLPSGGYEVGHSTPVIGVDASDKARVVWTEGTPVDDLVADISTLAKRG
ncbi:MAG: SCO family protein [Propionibacteriales bacterium]|nr:SCO family protein [Propionibacteriales bacterium]